MKVKIIPQVHFGQTFFYDDSQRTSDWLGKQEKSYQDLVNDFLDQVKPIQVFVYEDSRNGFLVTTIVYDEKENK